MKENVKKTKMFLLLLTLVVISFHGKMPVQAASKAPALSKTKLTMYKGESAVLSCKGEKGKKIVFQTSDAKIVKVSQKGTVKAVNTGKATIKVSYKGSSKKAECKVTVGEYAKSIKLNSAKTIILKEGATSQIKASVTPKKVLKTQITYKSADNEIATVNKNGKITGVSEGMTTVTLTSQAVSKKGKKLTEKVQVVVTKKEATDIADEDKEGTEGNGGTGDSGSAGGSGGSGGNGNSSSTGESPLIGTKTEGSKTTYTLDTTYAESVYVSISVNGQSFERSGNIKSILNELTSTYTTMTNSAGTICVSRELGEEWWTVTNPTNGDEVLFKVMADNSGQIIVDAVSAQVSVSIQ